MVILIQCKHIDGTHFVPRALWPPPGWLQLLPPLCGPAGSFPHLAAPPGAHLWDTTHPESSGCLDRGGAAAASLSGRHSPKIPWKHMSHWGNEQCGCIPIKWLHTDLLQTAQWDRVLVLQLTPVVPDCLDTTHLHTSFWGDDSSRTRISTDAFNNNVSDLRVKILQVYHMFLVQVHTFQHVLHQLMNLSSSCVFLKLNTLDHHCDLHTFQFGAGDRCELGRV